MNPPPQPSGIIVPRSVTDPGQQPLHKPIHARHIPQRGIQTPGPDTPADQHDHVDDGDPEEEEDPAHDQPADVVCDLEEDEEGGEEEEGGEDTGRGGGGGVAGAGAGWGGIGVGEEQGGERGEDVDGEVVQPWGSGRWVRTIVIAPGERSGGGVGVGVGEEGGEERRGGGPQVG